MKQPLFLKYSIENEFSIWFHDTTEAAGKEETWGKLEKRFVVADSKLTASL